MQEFIDNRKVGKITGERQRGVQISVPAWGGGVQTIFLGHAVLQPALAFLWNNT